MHRGTAAKSVVPYGFFDVYRVLQTRVAKCTTREAGSGIAQGLVPRAHRAETRWTDLPRGLSARAGRSLLLRCADSSHRVNPCDVAWLPTLALASNSATRFPNLAKRAADTPPKLAPTITISNSDFMWLVSSAQLLAGTCAPHRTYLLA
jgi:hypothetical protein